MATGASATTGDSGFGGDEGGAEGGAEGGDNAGQAQASAVAGLGSEEADYDPATGKPLPRVFVLDSSSMPDAADGGSPEAQPPPAPLPGQPGAPSHTPSPTYGANAPMGWPPPRRLERRFRRFWTQEQRDQADVDAMLSASGLKTSYESAVAEALRNGQSTPPPPAPEGRVADEFVAAVLGTISACAASLPEGAPFLWEAIHPQQPADQRPCYNPSGRYVVRVFVAGAWRCVEVDDMVPLNAKSEPVVLFSEHPRELWPTLLATAIYKVMALGSMGATHESLEFDPVPLPTTDDGKPLAVPPRQLNDARRTDARFGATLAFAVHTLTGWLPCVVPSVLPARPPPSEAPYQIADGGRGPGGPGGPGPDQREQGRMVVSLRSTSNDSVVSVNDERLDFSGRYDYAMTQTSTDSVVSVNEGKLDFSGRYDATQTIVVDAATAAADAEVALANSSGTFGGAGGGGEGEGEGEEGPSEAEVALAEVEALEDAAQVRTTLCVILPYPHVGLVGLHGMAWHGMVWYFPTWVH